MIPIFLIKLLRGDEKTLRDDAIYAIDFDSPSENPKACLPIQEQLIYTIQQWIMGIINA